MGKRGPSKTPTVILEQRGSWRAKERAANEPKPAANMPDKPDWLTDDAGIAWDRIAPALQKLGLLTEIDGNVLARYVTLWSRWRAASDFIARNGEYYPIYQSDKAGQHALDKNGNKILKYMAQFPQVGIVNKLGAALLRIEQEFGMTPSARASLVGLNAGNEDVDPLELLKRSMN